MSVTETWQISTTGLKETMAALSEMSGDLTGRVAQAFEEIVEETMTKAKEQTPVDTGALRASGHTSVTFSGSKIEAQLGFGGQAGSEDVGYAWYVHEDLEKKHIVGKAKFLEDPVTEATENLDEQIAQIITEIATETIGSK
jgi:hypothetical protein